MNKALYEEAQRIEGRKQSLNFFFFVGVVVIKGRIVSKGKENNIKQIFSFSFFYSTGGNSHLSFKIEVSHHGKQL